MLIRFLIVLTLSLTVGCTGNDDTKVVDFSRTIEVARPETKMSERQPLRVAVAAMVSPKETFVLLSRASQLYCRKGWEKRFSSFSEGLTVRSMKCWVKAKLTWLSFVPGLYALEKDKYGFELLATPEVNGSHFYQAYLIVNEKSPFEKPSKT